MRKNVALGLFKQKRCPLMNLTSNSTKILLATPQREGAGATWADGWTERLESGDGVKLVQPFSYHPSGVDDKLNPAVENCEGRSEGGKFGRREERGECAWQRRE